MKHNPLTQSTDDAEKTISESLENISNIESKIKYLKEQIKKERNNIILKQNIALNDIMERDAISEYQARNCHLYHCALESGKII